MAAIGSSPAAGPNPPAATGSQHGPKLRSRKQGAAIALDDLDKRLLNLMQGSFPIAPRPYLHVAEQAQVSEEEVLARVTHLLQERIIRQVTPIFDTRALGYSSMLVAAKVDPENPWRAASIINEHPGVSHNYLRNHEFNIWFTIATEPDSPLGVQGTLDLLARARRRRVGAPAADPEAVQDQDGPRDGGRHRCAVEVGRGGRAGRNRAPAI